MKQEALTKCSRHLRAALRQAAELASVFGHQNIEPAHLLVGLARTPGALGGELIGQTKLDLEALEGFLKSTLPMTGRPVILSPASQYRLVKAAMMAERTRHHYIGTEHLLKAIIDDPGPTLTTFFKEIHPWHPEAIAEQLEMVLKSGAKLPELTATFTESETMDESDAGAIPAPVRQFGVHLTHPENENRLNPVIGREEEIERVMQILSRRTKNNPVLLGDPGVGKTAIVEGLAKKILHGQVPHALKDKKILTLDIGSLVAGTMFRGEFESRLKQIIEELQRHPEIIVFIDELHTIVGAGAASGSVDAANILKPALARGEIRCIGATTIEEYRRYIESDGALERRFQPVQVNEPSPREARDILAGIKSYYESFHGLNIGDDALDAAVALSDRYLTDRYLPDKAIDLIDEAAARVKIQTALPAPLERLRELEQAERLASDRKERAAINERFEEALHWQKEEQRLGSEHQHAEAELKKNPPLYPTVGKTAVAEVLTSWTKIPVRDLLAEEKEMLRNLEDRIHATVVGQIQAVQTVAATIRRARLDLSDHRRPLASFFFVGPTGVGKTTLARALAHALFGSEQALLRLDMTEFSEAFTVSKLIGAPAGYVGYKESGLLTERVRRQPYQVILFDELDRGHREIYQLLLQILEEGSLRDATGRLINFKQTIIVASANPLRQNIKLLGFDDNRKSTVNPESEQQQILETLRDIFPPELLNRFDAILPFSALTADDLLVILEREVGALNERLRERRVTIAIPKEAATALVAAAVRSNEGARGLRHYLQRYVENVLAEKLLERSSSAAKTYTLRHTRGRWMLS